MPYIDPETVARAREMDLLTYLQARDPEELVRTGPASWRTRTHDSLKLSNGKWYWWSRGIGGRSALDYLVEVKGMGFTDAVREIVGDAAAPTPGRTSPPRQPPRHQPREFSLPPEAGTEAALAYLRGRGIDGEILDELHGEGAVYGSRRYSHQNVVFVGRDAAGTPRYASIRACAGGFKGEASGSDKRFGFAVEQRGGPIEVHVFESAIDALSFATLYKIRGGDWRTLSLLSLGGIPPVRPGSDFKVPCALDQWLGDHPLCSEVRLHLDNDGPGRAAARAIAERISPHVPVGIEPPATGKDVNEHLLGVLAGRETGQRRERGGDRGCR